MVTNVGEIVYTVNADTSPLLKGEKAVSQATGRMENKFNGLAAAIKGVLVGGAIASLVKTLSNTQRKFDILNAGLVTATGNTQNAAKAFKVLENFAATTPFALEQSVKAFTQLVNLGLTPSERALRSYGNTASAMGKDLSQLVEAVADAATGEFERLKEFGIKAKNNGDTIALTFRGMTTNVKNSAADIESFLIGLGENNFAGAMAARMDTLDGAISNMDDSWDSLLRTMAAAGPGSVIRESVEVATSAITEMTALIGSGQIQGMLSAIGGGFSQAFGEVQTSALITAEFFKIAMSDIAAAAGLSSNFLSDAFFQFPANIRAVVQIATAHLAGFIDKVKAFGTLVSSTLSNIFDDEAIGAADKAYTDSLNHIDATVKSVTSNVLDQRTVAINKINEEIRAADNLRQAYDRANAATGASGGDVLAGFKAVPDAGAAATPEQGIQEADTATKNLQERLARLAEAATHPAEELKNSWVGALIDVSDQIGSTLGRAIVQGDSLKETFKGVARSIAADMIGSLIKVGVQMAVNAAIGKTSLAATTAASVAGGATIAAAWAPAAAATSLASFGANAAPAAAGLTSTYGLASALSIGGGKINGGPVSAGRAYPVAEDGRPEIFSDGNRQFLIPGRSGNVTSNKDMRGGEAPAVSVNINVQNNASGAGFEVSGVRQDGGQVTIDAIVSDIRSGNGPVSKAISESTSATRRTQ